MPNLADLVRVNDANLSDSDFTNVFSRAPLIEALEAVPASNGTEHKYLVETGAPVVGFRPHGQGRTNTSGTEQRVTAELKVMDASFSVDVALADRYRMGPEAFIAREASRHLRAALFGIEAAIINGTGGNDAFAGLAQAVTASLNAEAFMDAGGQQNPESVWLLNSTEDGFAFVTDEQIEVGETIEQQVVDAQGKPYHAYVTKVLSQCTIQIGGLFEAVRIANVGSEPGKGLTDDLIHLAEDKFPAGKEPNLVVMSGRSRGQLRRSRIATSPTGASVPQPTEVEGIGRIIRTNTIPV